MRRDDTHLMRFTIAWCFVSSILPTRIVKIEEDRQAEVIDNEDGDNTQNAETKNRDYALGVN